MKTLLGPGGPSTMVPTVAVRVDDQPPIGMGYGLASWRADEPAMVMPKPSVWRRALAWVTRRAA